MRLDPERLLAILQSTICASVRADAPDLSARQLAALLIIGLDPEMHTVRGLAARLNISKPAISRSLDRLCVLQLADRTEDPRDRRSILVVPTEAGMDYVSGLRAMMGEAANPRRRTYQRSHLRDVSAHMAAE
jgi:DNA-binding MarR family transcriptional regulator